MTQTLTIAKAKQDLAQLVTNTHKRKNRYVIMVGGKPAALLTPLPTDEYESWKETYEILSDKKLMKDIKRAEKDIDAGKYITLDELKKDLGLHV